MAINFQGIWKQLPGVWETALPQFWEVAHETIARVMEGAEPKVVEALTDDVIEDFRIRLCGARTFKGLEKTINKNTWQTFLRDAALEAVALHRESIVTGDYWRLRPLKQRDPQAWLDIKLDLDGAVEKVCVSVIASHTQADNWLPIWRSCPDEYIEAIIAEFQRNGIHRCYSWNEVIPHLCSLAKYRIRDLMIRKAKQQISHIPESDEEDFDVFWRLQDKGHPLYKSTEHPDADSHFARQDLLELFKVAGVSNDFASMVIEHTCDGTPAKELSQRLAEPLSPATVYTRMQDAMEAVKAYASDPDNQRRWLGSVAAEAKANMHSETDQAASEQSNLK